MTAMQSGHASPVQGKFVFSSSFTSKIVPLINRTAMTTTKQVWYCCSQYETNAKVSNAPKASGLFSTGFFSSYSYSEFIINCQLLLTNNLDDFKALDTFSCFTACEQFCCLKVNQNPILLFAALLRFLLVTMHQFKKTFKYFGKHIQR